MKKILAVMMAFALTLTFPRVCGYQQGGCRHPDSKVFDRPR